MRVVLAFTCLINIIFVSNAFSETKAGSVGRYSDGRAYRVDNQGYQLSDQIAELEATIKEQEIQLSACEGEKAGKVDLPKPIQCPKIECPAIKAPVALQPTADLCSPFTTTLNSEISSLREKLSKAPRPEAIGALSEESLQLRKSLIAAEDKAKSALDAEKSKSAQQENVNQQLTSKVAELSAEIEHKNKREGELLANIEKLNQQLASASELTKAAPARGMLASKAPAETPNVIKITKEESTADRATITARLSEIQKLVIKRKDIFDSARSNKRGITIQMQPLVTENGVSLDQLRQRAGSETSEFGALSHGLNEIKSILNSDIQVMERLIQHL